MPKITVLSATDRPGSMALKISKFTAEKLIEQGAEAQVVSLEDYPLQDVVGGKYGQDIPSVKAFNDNVLDADGVVMVVPEYNGSFPGILKVFIDYLPFPESFEKLPIAFIGEAAGAFGSVRSVEQLQMICNYRNAYLFPERIFLQRVNKIFNEKDGITDEFSAKLMNSLIANFVSFTDRNKIARS
ncbi:MAG: NAD(P)H-dependent oxidoreductase [Balneolales bacterium]|nr:NAD(P)H-dependent oxidoreductase [Balneolales bacterium]